MQGSYVNRESSAFKQEFTQQRTELMRELLAL